MRMGGVIMRGSIINKTATGQKIRDRMDEVGIDVRDINIFFNFTSLTAFYYWRRGTKIANTGTFSGSSSHPRRLYE